MTDQHWIDIIYEAAISVVICLGFLTGSRSEAAFLAGVALWAGLLAGYACGRIFVVEK